MYQVLIIDDEPIVRAGIIQLIPWENYDFKICAEGIDGKDGLRKILEYSPDLVLVDVKMPGMNGIELIREAKKQNFEGRFIILTGYSDFEFAKSAISLGVRAYLLKPIDEDELLENVQEVYMELEAKKNLDDYYTSSELNARKEVLYRLLLNREDKDVLRKEIKLYGMDYKYQSFCVAVLTPPSDALKQGYVYDTEKQDMIRSGLKHVDTVIMDENLILICKGGTYHEYMERLIKNNERFMRHFGEKLSISIGHDVAHWEDLYYSYECAKLLSDYRFLYRDQPAVSIDALNVRLVEQGDNFAEKLCNYIEVADLQAIDDLLDKIKNYYKGKVVQETEIKVQIIHNIVLLFGMLEKKYYDKKEEFPSFDALMDRVKKAESLEKLLNDIREFAAASAECIGSSSTENIVKRVLVYMERNYVQDLKLEEIARIFNYNSAYLGKIFKKVMNDSFNNVLNGIRIENAKRLLLETDLKVYQVSEQVGYNNTDYFYSKFRKYVGVSPKEFVEDSQRKE